MILNVFTLSSNWFFKRKSTDFKEVDPQFVAQTHAPILCSGYLKSRISFGENNFVQFFQLRLLHGSKLGY